MSRFTFSSTQTSSVQPSTTSSCIPDPCSGGPCSAPSPASTSSNPIPVNHLMLNLMEQKMMNDMTQMASQWMNLYRTISYQQSHGMDEMKRIWLRKLMFDCLTLEEQNSMFGLQRSERVWGISKTKSYVHQIEETCEWLCRMIQMMCERVRMLNVQMKTQWMSLMTEFMNDLKVKKYLREEDSDSSSSEECESDEY